MKVSNRRFHKDHTLPMNGEIFVFGSNLAGRHGKGAALVAKNEFNAINGRAEGYQYQETTYIGPTRHCYAIPTKDEHIQTLPLNRIRIYVHTFVKFSKRSQATFFVTRVGCRLAGYKDEDIAPMFAECGDNVIFPEEWRLFLT